MSHALHYRDDSRTTTAFVLSVLLHGLLAGILAALFFARPATPPETTHILELMAGPSAANESSSPGSQTTTPNFSNLKSFEPVQSKPPTPIQPVQQEEVAPPTPRTPTVVIPPKNPVTPRGQTQTTTQPKNTMTYQEYLKAHPQTVAPSRRSSGPPAATVPKLNVNPDRLVDNLDKYANRGGGSQRSGPSSDPSGGGGTSDDYDTRLRQRVYEAFSVPPGSSGLSAGIQLVIGADGTIMEKHLTRLSGNELFDAAVRQALERLTNVDPPPGGEKITRNLTLVPKGQ